MNQKQLGLKENRKAFALLVLINAFVGGMVGMERTILPEIAESLFGISSKTAILSFIVAFGLTKAAANYYAGRMANSVGRKNLLLLGWIIALPIPWMLINAADWNWVIFANILLGVSQGLTWSSTVVMKIDLVGPRHRGLAMGLNEFSGYLAVGIVAFLTGWLAHHYGVTPYPFYVGIVLSVVGTILTWIWVQDTAAHVQLESKDSTRPWLGNVFTDTSFRSPTLSSITQAGLVNNLNDGLVWGILPILLIGQWGYSIEDAGWITGAYPAVWGMGQLFTGKMADHYAKKQMLFWGMLIQAFALTGFILSSNFWVLLIFSSLLGFGTALVYPTFMASIAQVVHPTQRAESIGVFRLWRDSGYAFGAIISGIMADAFGIHSAIGLVALLTLISSLIILIRMDSLGPED